MIKCIKCPVCKKELLEVGLKNHILNSAEGECYRSMNRMLDFSKMKPYEFSPRVFLTNAPHLSFYRMNLKSKKYFTFGEKYRVKK